MLALGATCATAQIALDNFNSGSATGAVKAGTSWVGNLTQNATTLTVGGTAKDDNGYGVTGLNINASAMTYVRITAQRDANHVDTTLKVAFEDGTAAINSAIFSVSTSAFAVGTLTQVQIPISTWGSDFVPSQVA